MDVFIDLLFLIVLAAMANQSKRMILSGLIFGSLKAISIYLIYLSELDETIGESIAIGATHFVLNSILGIAIAYIVVKHSKETKMVILMTILSILSFLTHIASLNVLSIL
jgi:ABC-type spermidine/putrescine transport system permease subunit I